MIEQYKKSLCSIFTIIVVTLLFVHVDNLNADELGRLFTTVEERIKLEELRQDKPMEIKIVDIDIDETEDVKEQETEIGGITVNGLVYRKDGKSTAWINNSNTYQGDMSNQYLRVDAENINPEHVQVELPASVTKITLKAGQTYDPATAEIIDLTDNYREQ